MSKQRLTGRQKRNPRGVELSVHNRLKDREAADEALLARERREERRREALEEATREQERLERRIAREKLHPALGPTLGAVYAAESEQVENVPAPPPIAAWEIPTPVDTPPLALLFPGLPWEGDGESLTIGEARALLRQGYNIRRVVRQSGVGLKWLDDIPIDEAGFGRLD